MKGKTEHIIIEPKYTKLPNPMHLSAQQTYRATVFKPKKGKGSYDRRANKKIDFDY